MLYSRVRKRGTSLYLDVKESKCKEDEASSIKICRLEKQVKSEPAKEILMNKDTILKLMKSAECKCPAEINEYTRACKELNIIKVIDGQMTVNMKSVIEITDFVIQGNNPEIVSFIKETCYKKSGKTLLPDFKFKGVWRKVQAEWGRMYPYIKIITNGMYFPFNEEVLDCVLELLEAFNNDALLYNEELEEIIVRCKKIPYIEVVKAMRRELGIN